MGSAWWPYITRERTHRKKKKKKKEKQKNEEDTRKATINSVVISVVSVIDVCSSSELRREPIYCSLTSSFLIISTDANDSSLSYLLSFHSIPSSTKRGKGEEGKKEGGKGKPTPSKTSSVVVYFLFLFLGLDYDTGRRDTVYGV